MVVPHEELDRIENRLPQGTKVQQVFLDWMHSFYNREFKWDLEETGRRDAARTRSTWWP